MGARPLPRESRSDRRGLISETTLKLISEQGVDAITHRRVAEAAGVPLGSTTYYFKSREHLIQAGFDHYLELHGAMRAEIGERDPGDLNDLVDFAIALTELFHNRRDLLRAEYEMTLFAARNETLAASVRGWDSRLLASIERLLTANGVEDPAPCAHSVLQMIRGFELQSLFGLEVRIADLRTQLTTLIRAYAP